MVMCYFFHLDRNQDFSSTLSDKISSEITFVGGRTTLFIRQDFRHFGPTKVCPIRWHLTNDPSKEKEMEGEKNQYNQ